MPDYYSLAYSIMHPYHAELSKTVSPDYVLYALSRALRATKISHRELHEKKPKQYTFYTPTSTTTINLIFDIKFNYCSIVVTNTLSISKRSSVSGVACAMQIIYLF